MHTQSSTRPTSAEQKIAMSNPCWVSGRQLCLSAFMKPEFGVWQTLILMEKLFYILPTVCCLSHNIALFLIIGFVSKKQPLNIFQHLLTNNSWNVSYLFWQINKTTINVLRNRVSVPVTNNRNSSTLMINI